MQQPDVTEVSQGYIRKASNAGAALLPADLNAAVSSHTADRGPDDVGEHHAA